MQNRIYKTELIEWQKVKDLQPDNLKLPYNYNHIKQSILKHGISKAYDVCELDGDLYWIDGHTRTQILMELVSDGVDVPEMLTANFCRVKDRKEAIEILLEVHNQRQNPIAEEVLAEWIDVEMVEVAVESLNVKVVEVVEADHETLQAQEDDFDATPPVEPITVLGDLYEIGEHRLLCGDSTDSDQVAKLMNGEKADMVFTDPPFPNNSEIMHDMIKNIDGAFNNSRLFCDKLMIWFWDNLEFPPFLEQVTSKHIWHKTNGWQAGHFETMYCYHNDEKRHEQKVYSVNNVGGDNNREEQGNHPTPKPIRLIFEIINDLSKNSKLILDLFLGSGTTMVASHQLKRKCYGMELDCRYADVIVRRMLKLDDTLTVKRNGVDCTKEFKNGIR